MKKDYIDSELYEIYEILHFEPETSPQVRGKIDAAYETIRETSANAKPHSKSVKTHSKSIKQHGEIAKPHTNYRKNVIYADKRKKKRRIFLSFAAALILILGFVGFYNPVMAAKIPFIGRIFDLVGSSVGYPGNYSENSISTEGPSYSQSVNGVTITLSEASYTEMALYYSLELYCEEGFPEDFNKVKNMKDYILSYDILNMQSTQSFDFTQADPEEYYTGLLSCSIEEGLPTPYSIEGNFVDSHTFLGIIRIDLYIIRDILNVKKLPTEFTYSFTINKFWGELSEAEDVDAIDSDGRTITIKQPIRKYYEGPWSFSLPVALNQTASQTKEIMETNSEGIGISTVTKTQYEIIADIILPDNAKPEDYIIAITDADGKILESQGNYAEVYSVYGRNTDTVYVYVVDYCTFMDECKANNAYRLPQKALFQTKIDWK